MINNTAISPERTFVCVFVFFSWQCLFVSRYCTVYTMYRNTVHKYSEMLQYLLQNLFRRSIQKSYKLKYSDISPYLFRRNIHNWNIQTCHLTCSEGVSTIDLFRHVTLLVQEEYPQLIYSDMSPYLFRRSIQMGVSCSENSATVIPPLEDTGRNLTSTVLFL